MRRLLAIVALRRSGRVLAIIAALSSLPASAMIRERPAGNPNGTDVLPVQLQDVGIDDNAGKDLPKGIVLRDEDGQPIQLDSLFDGKRPVVMVLAYFSCPMLCTVVLNHVTEGLKDVAWTIGREFRVVTVSIDQRDTPAIAKEKEKNYLAEYGRPVPDGGWHFLTGDAVNVKRLADALGFRYHWDAGQKQFAHAAGAFILTPAGRISHTFYGISFPGKDLKLALVDASNGAFSSAVDRLLLFCFHVDPNTGKYTLAVTRLMAAGAALTVLIVGLWMVVFWRRDARRTAASHL